MGIVTNHPEIQGAAGLTLQQFLFGRPAARVGDVRCGGISTGPLCNLIPAIMRAEEKYLWRNRITHRGSLEGHLGCRTGLIPIGEIHVDRTPAAITAGRRIKHRGEDVIQTVVTHNAWIFYRCPVGTLR